MPNKQKKYPCPVCGSISYVYKNDYQVCPVCGWEDDESQTLCPNEKVFNRYPFSEYKKKWQCGETIHQKYPNPKAV